MKRLLLSAITAILFTSRLFAQTTPSDCPNLDAEMGTFANWAAGTGICCPINITNVGFAFGRQTIVGPNGYDPKIPAPNQIPVVPPGGGNHAIKLGNDNVNSEAEEVSYTVTVTPNTALFIYRYAVLLQDPQHDSVDQPRFQIRMTDGFGQNIACGQYNVVASAGIPGFLTYNHPVDGTIRYKKWTTVGMDLTPYMGQNVKITFRTGDCNLGAHYGYAYIDCYCSPLEIENAFCPNASSAVLTAPEGFSSYLWSTNETTQSITVYNPSLGGAYSVTMTSVTGCSVTLNTTVASTSVQAGFAAPLTCQNDAHFLDQSIAFNGAPIAWNWDFGDSSPIDTAQNPIHVFANSGQYNVTLIVRSDHECNDTLTMPVTIFPAPVAVATVAPICETKDAQFYGNASSVLYGNVISWFWTFGDGTLSADTNPVHNYPVAGTYPVDMIVTSDLLCTDTAHLDQVVHPTPIFSAGVDTAVCGGSIVDLGSLANPFYNYSWLPTTGILSPTSGSTQAIIPEVFDFARTFSYLLTGIDPLTGCISYDTVSIISRVIPPASFTPPPPQCFAGNVFEVHAITGPFGTNYNWSLDTSSSLQISNTQYTIPFTFSSPGHKPVVLTTELDGCADTLVDSIIVYEQPYLDITPEVSEGCPPLTVTFTNNSIGPGPTFQWNFSDGSSSVEPTGTHVFTEAGTYTLWVTMITPDGCTDTKSFPNFVRILPRPVSLFDVDSSVVSILNPRINTYDHSTGATEFQYDFSDGTIVDSRNAAHQFQDTGVFNIQYIVTNAFGCKDTSYKPVKVEPFFTFYVPNAFSPNGDGTNDKFQGYGKFFNTYEMRIYNRWGREIYFTDEYAKPWDGKVGGEVSQNDVYEYRIVVNDLHDISHTYIGHVTLVK